MKSNNLDMVNRIYGDLKLGPLKNPKLKTHSLKKLLDNMKRLLRKVKYIIKDMVETKPGNKN